MEAISRLIVVLFALAALVGVDLLIINYAANKWTRALSEEVEFLLVQYILPRMNRSDKEFRHQEWEQWKAEHPRDRTE